MSCKYEEFADLFLSTLVGQSTGLTRVQFIDLCKARFPSEDAFEAHVIDVQARAASLMANARARLESEGRLAVAIPIDLADSNTRPTLH